MVFGLQRVLRNACARLVVLEFVELDSVIRFGSNSVSLSVYVMSRSDNFCLALATTRHKVPKPPCVSLILLIGGVEGGGGKLKRIAAVHESALLCQQVLLCASHMSLILNVWCNQGIH